MSIKYVRIYNFFLLFRYTVNLKKFIKMAIRAISLLSHYSKVQKQK